MLTKLDVFNPSPAGAEPPTGPASSAGNLEANVWRLNIDVDRIAPMHGHVVPYS